MARAGRARRRTRCLVGKAARGPQHRATRAYSAGRRDLRGAAFGARALHRRRTGRARDPRALRASGRGVRAGARRGPRRRGRDADRQRQEPLLPPAGARTRWRDDPSARALYLFPTKALARDQEAALRALAAATPGSTRGAITYDGDTPGDARRAAREQRVASCSRTRTCCTPASCRTTPAGRACSRSLRYVVVDELHTYRGVFGSHLANVLRAARCASRASTARDRRLHLRSATIGNPREHAARLLGADDGRSSSIASGAPLAAARVLRLQPAGRERRARHPRELRSRAAVRLAADLVRARVPHDRVRPVAQQRRGDAQVPARRSCATRPAPDAIMALPRRLPARDAARDRARRCATGEILLRGRDQRARARHRHRRPRRGRLRRLPGLASRRPGSASGAPGAAAARASRPRRVERAARSVPRARAASYLLGAPIEQARIDPDNVEILVQHLKCAAFELPFEAGEALRRASPRRGRRRRARLPGATTSVLAHGAGATAATAVYHWAADAYPGQQRLAAQRRLGQLRRSSTSSDERTIAEMDWRAAHTMLHEQAIYQHDGEQYQVERLDYENHKAFVRKVEPDYFTTAMTYTHVSACSRSERGRGARRGAHASGWGDVRVVEKVVGYKKIKFYTHENAGYGDVQPARDADAHQCVLADRARSSWSRASASARRCRRCAARHRARAADRRGVGLDGGPARPRSSRSGTRAIRMGVPGKGASGGRASIRRSSCTTGSRAAWGSRRASSRRATSCCGARAG